MATPIYTQAQLDKAINLRVRQERAFCKEWLHKLQALCEKAVLDVGARSERVAHRKGGIPGRKIGKKRKKPDLLPWEKKDRFK